MTYTPEVQVLYCPLWIQGHRHWISPLGHQMSQKGSAGDEPGPWSLRAPCRPTSLLFTPSQRVDLLQSGSGGHHKRRSRRRLPQMGWRVVGMGVEERRREAACDGELLLQSVHPFLVSRMSLDIPGQLAIARVRCSIMEVPWWTAWRCCSIWVRTEVGTTTRSLYEAHRRAHRMRAKGLPVQGHYCRSL